MAEQKTSTARCFLFTGGGTGGHVAPALAIAEELRQRHPEARFHYVGVAGKAEATMVPRAWKLKGDGGTDQLHFVRSQGFPGKSPRLLIFALVLLLGVLKAMTILIRYRPQLVVATGGYVSAPIVFAVAALRKLRLANPVVFIHEQNAAPGRMNQLGVRIANRVGVSFPGTPIARSKRLEVGYPVRKMVSSSQDPDAVARARAEARAELEIPADAKVVFAFGGSQGARTINRLMVDALPQLLEDPSVYVIHGTGKRLKGNAYDGMADVQTRTRTLQGLPADWEKRVIRKDFFHDMGTYYAATDVVVCRAGAGSLNEVCAYGVAAVTIPKANLPGDHQACNARVMERLGAAAVVYERVAVESLDTEGPVESVAPQSLMEVLSPLLQDFSARAEMCRKSRELFDPGTNSRIADWLEYLVQIREEPDPPTLPELEEERVLGLGHGAMVGFLQRLHGGRTDEPPLSEDERRLALYKIDGYLASSSFTPVARGCRMVGFGGFEERLPILCFMARVPNGQAREIWPIVRRDALHGIGLLGSCDAQVLSTLKESLSDPYFEARYRAAWAIKVLSAGHRDALSDLVPVLVQTHEYSYFEVRIQVLLALGEVATAFEPIAAALRAHRFDSNWKVRQALLTALSRLAERGIISEEIAGTEGREVMLSGSGYLTHYPLKKAYNDLPGRHLVAEDVPVP
jgi:UDP-N-acetylglucosamine--N-acetylmuramyl-(pentapeptide) pyrophosphoryl-undecaprenol N-acetylglucosamine transferase